MGAKPETVGTIQAVGEAYQALLQRKATDSYSNAAKFSETGECDSAQVSGSEADRLLGLRSTIGTLFSGFVSTLSKQLEGVDFSPDYPLADFLLTQLTTPSRRDLIIDALRTGVSGFTREGFFRRILVTDDDRQLARAIIDLPPTKAKPAEPQAPKSSRLDIDHNQYRVGTAAIRPNATDTDFAHSLYPLVDFARVAIPDIAERYLRDGGSPANLQSQVSNIRRGLAARLMQYEEKSPEKQPCLEQFLAEARQLYPHAYPSDIAKRIRGDAKFADLKKNG